jgi:uncharacterized SAM-binding protein YcdF (DUF218 family)
MMSTAAGAEVRASGAAAPPLGRARRRLRLSSLVYGAALGALAGFCIRDLDLPALVSFERPQELLVVVASLIGVLLALTRFRRILGAAALLLALLWCLVAFSPLSRWLSHGLTRFEVAEPADAVFVSSSGLRPGGQRLAEARSRFFYGVDLVVRNKTRRLILTESVDIPGTAIVRQLLESAGVVPELLVAGRAETTHEEAVAVGRLVKERGFKLILLVTSPIHSRRASAALEREGVTVVSSPSPETRFDLERLPTSSARLTAFGSVIHERLGFWVYARRGWVDPGLD